MLVLILYGIALVIAGMLFGAETSFLLRLGGCGFFTAIGVVYYHKWLGWSYNRKAARGKQQSSVRSKLIS